MPRLPAQRLGRQVVPDRQCPAHRSLPLAAVRGRVVPRHLWKVSSCGRRYYKWRAKYGGMAVSDAKRLRALEEENRRLKQLLADTMLDNQALKGLLAKNW